MNDIAALQLSASIGATIYSGIIALFFSAIAWTYYIVRKRPLPLQLLQRIILAVTFFLNLSWLSIDVSFDESVEAGMGSQLLGIVLVVLLIVLAVFERRMNHAQKTQQIRRSATLRFLLSWLIIPVFVMVQIQPLLALTTFPLRGNVWSDLCVVFGVLFIFCGIIGVVAHVWGRLSAVRRQSQLFAFFATAQRVEILLWIGIGCFVLATMEIVPSIIALLSIAFTVWFLAKIPDEVDSRVRS